MKPTREQLLQLIEKTGTWVQIGDNYGVIDANLNQDDIEADWLADIDPRLPIALAHLMQKQHELGKRPCMVPGYAVRATLDEWVHPKPIIHDIYGGPFQVTKIRSIAVDASTSRVTLSILAQSTDVIRADVNGQDTPVRVVTSTHNQDVPVPTWWMNKEYAGWATRYLALEALGVTGEDLVAQVMVQPINPPAASLDGIEFD